MIDLKESYQPRPIRFLELWQEADWRIKVYGIAYQRALPRPELVEAARRIVQRDLPLHTKDKRHYHCAFLGIHDGRGENFVFFDFWADENELHHHVYVSPSQQPAAFRYTTPTGLIACVWDLRVMCFERQAWLEAVLANPAGADTEAYLARRLNEDV